MSNNESDNGTPIKDYIESAIAQIKSSLPADARVEGTVDIEISTFLEKGKDGGFNIKVLNLGAKVSESQIHRITVPIKIVTETDLIKEEAERAVAEAKKRAATHIR